MAIRRTRDLLKNMITVSGEEGGRGWVSSLQGGAWVKP